MSASQSSDTDSHAAVHYVASHEQSKRCAKQTDAKIVDGNERELREHSLERMIRQASINKLSSRTLASTFVGLLLISEGEKTD